MEEFSHTQMDVKDVHPRAALRTERLAEFRSALRAFIRAPVTAHL